MVECKILNTVDTIYNKLIFIILIGIYLTTIFSIHKKTDLGKYITAMRL